MIIHNNRLNKLVNRETVLYGVVGICTSILNVLLFQVFLFINVNYRHANIITLLIVKLAAYICNKNLVFQSHTENTYELLKEFGRFIIARGATMIIDYLGLIFMVEVLDIRAFISKCAITLFVIILNYFIGKKHVFKSNMQNDKEKHI
jgi:putative flippase GtrA